MRDAFVVAAVRTPIGRFQGALSPVRPDDLAALVLAEAVRRAGVDPTHVDEVVLGCANQAGEDNRNVARMSLLLAGFPQHVPGFTVNRLCASGLEAINLGVRAIRCEDADLVVAGGVESMSRAPYSLPRGPQQARLGNITAWDTSLGWRYPNARLEQLFPLEAMGETAENLVQRFDITREDQDRFALASHERAVRATEEGWFTEETIGVDVDGRVVDRDEGPRPDTSLASLAKLKPAFRKGGTVTAGNSSTLNDGAAAVVLASADAASRLGLPVRARVVGSAAAGVDPRFMGIGPVPASRRALERAGWNPRDVDVWELNEAFAAQSLAVARELDIGHDRLNLHGGAIALGHPLGCSGARLFTTLLSVMRRTGARRGAASLCVGVGQGVTTLVESMA